MCNAGVFLLHSSRRFRLAAEMGKLSVPTYRATFYTDKAIGQLGLGGLNEVGRAKGTVQAYHRGNVTEDGESPFAVANDFIGSEIGRLLGLPIPPGAITRSELDMHRPMYSCLDFDWTRETLVNAEPDECATSLPDESTGILLFDVLIANPDRFPWNLKADSPLDPTYLRVYDHADAIFGVEGESRLNSIQLTSLGFNWPNRNKNDHCLLPHLRDGRFRETWYGKIGMVPDFQIQNVCNAAMASGLSKGQAMAVRDFLIYRKHHITDIVDANRSAFQLSFFATPPGELQL